MIRIFRLEVTPKARTIDLVFMAASPRLTRFIARFAALLLAAPALSGWAPMGKVNAVPALLNEKFGCSVAVDGQWLAVGASDSTLGAMRSTGAVHLFRNDGGTWVYRQSLFQENPLAYQAFGNAVALRGDTLAVGSWGTNRFGGRVFVYNLGANGIWSLATTLDAADPQPSKPALFGWSLSLDTPAGAPAVIAVGRPNDGALSTGAIYLFERVDGTWTQAAKLSMPDATNGDQLGTTVSVNGGTVVAGISRRRRAAIFERVEGVWSYATSLVDAGGATGDGYGSSVASAGSIVAVGSPSRASAAGATKAGAVTVFERANGAWAQAATLTLGAPVTGDNLGYAVATRAAGPGGRAIIVASAPGFDLPNTDAGAGFAWTRQPSGWQRDSTDLWSNQALRGQFAGKSIAISASGTLVALGTDSPRGSIGGVFPMQWSADSTGSSATRDGSGTSSGSGTGTTSGSSSSGSGGNPSGGGSDSGDVGGDDASDPSGTFGQGGRPRPLQPLPGLRSTFGTVTDTVIVDTGAGLQSVVGLQTDGVQRFGEPVATVLATYPAGWRLVATGDANGDASGDFVWQDNDRKIRVWLRDGSTFLAQNTLRDLGPREQVMACVDFDGDGIADVVTRDDDTRQVNVLRMRNGLSTTEWSVPIPSLDWRPLPQTLDTGMLLRNDATGEVVRVGRDPLSGDVFSEAVPSPDRDTSIEGVGDVDGDGAPDLVCRNPGEDEISLWRLDRRLRLIAARDLGIDGGAWKVEAVRDWDGNGCDDLLLSRGGGGRLVVLYLHKQDGIVKILKSRLIGNTGGARVVDVTRR